jgi:hypothetical protein
MRLPNQVCHLLFAFGLAALSQSPVLLSAITPRMPTKPPTEGDLNPAKPIIDGMQDAGARLKQGDTGAATRTIQEKVVNDIQKLIDAVKPKSQGAKQRQNSASSRKSGSQSNSEKPQSQPDSPGSSKPATSGQPSRKSGAGKPSISEKDASVRPKRPLLREVWGHLPPALRERVRSDFQEAVLPAYDDLVRRYFEALLNGSSSTPSNRAGSSPTPNPASPASSSPAQ